MSIQNDDYSKSKLESEMTMTIMDSDQRQLKVEDTLDPNSTEFCTPINCINTTTNPPNAEDSGSNCIVKMEPVSVSGGYNCKICMISAASQQELEAHFNRDHNISVKVSRIVKDFERRVKRESTGKASRLLKSIKNERGLAYTSLDNGGFDDIQEKLSWMCKEMNVVSPHETAQLRMLLRLRCTICYVAFLSQDAFHEHLRLHLDGLIDTCPHCEMDKHKFKVHPQPPNSPHQSNQLLVNQTTPSKGSKDETVFPNKCDKCSSTFANNNSLIFHKTGHNHDGLHRCPQCKKSFVHDALMTKHINSVHKSGSHVVHNPKEEQSMQTPWYRAGQSRATWYRARRKARSMNTHGLQSSLPIVKVRRRKSSPPLPPPQEKVHDSGNFVRKCSYCHLRFQKRTEQTSHLFKEHGINLQLRKPFICYLCQSGIDLESVSAAPSSVSRFIAPAYLITHLRKYHPTYTPLQMLTFRPTKNNIKNTKGTGSELSEPNKDFHVDIVGERGSTEANFECGLLKVKNVKGRLVDELRCPYCKVIYGSMFALNRHIRLNHSTVSSSEYIKETSGLTRCLWCPCVFPMESKKALTLHMTAMHKDKVVGQRKQAELTQPTNTTIEADK